MRGCLQYAQGVVLAHDRIFFAIQRDFVARILAELDPVAGFEIEGYQFPVIETPALADCDYSPSCGFSCAESGMIIPRRVVSRSSIRLPTIRSYRGLIFIMYLLATSLQLGLAKLAKERD